MTLSWAQQYRLEWIAEMLSIYGFINREHLQKKFRISTPQASLDIKLYNKMNPGAAIYDHQLKQYRQQQS